MDEATALATAEAGADLIGLVFAESKRKLSTENAIKIVGALNQWRKEQGQQCHSSIPQVFF